MDKIPTAYEFLMNFTDEPNDDTIYKAMIEFAKMHCEAQVKEILDNVEVVDSWTDGISGCAAYAKRESITNAYPLENIK